MKAKDRGKRKKSLEVYDILREFHKNELNDAMDKYELTEWEENALITLSGVLYLCEEVFSREAYREEL